MVALQEWAEKQAAPPGAAQVAAAAARPAEGAAEAEAVAAEAEAVLAVAPPRRVSPAASEESGGSGELVEMPMVEELEAAGGCWMSGAGWVLVGCQIAKRRWVLASKQLWEQHSPLPSPPAEKGSFKLRCPLQQTAVGCGWGVCRQAEQRAAALLAALGGSRRSSLHPSLLSVCRGGHGRAQRQRRRRRPERQQRRRRRRSLTLCWRRQRRRRPFRALWSEGLR